MVTGARDVDRLAVGAVGAARVGDADRRRVHGGAAVDDVADPRLARVDVTVVQAKHQPLLRQEEALDRVSFRPAAGFKQAVGSSAWVVALKR
jgi:hypothetical protein